MSLDGRQESDIESTARKDGSFSAGESHADREGPQAKTHDVGIANCATAYMQGISTRLPQSADALAFLPSVQSTDRALTGNPASLCYPRIRERAKGASLSDAWDG